MLERPGRHLSGHIPPRRGLAMTVEGHNGHCGIPNTMSVVSVAKQRAAFRY